MSFTYSNSITSTYIDHILVPQYLIDMITNCDILEDNVSNMSDHYAICVSLRLPLYDATDRGPDSGAVQYLAIPPLDLSGRIPFMKNYMWQNFLKPYKMLLYLTCHVLPMKVQ